MKPNYGSMRQLAIIAIVSLLLSSLVSVSGVFAPATANADAGIPVVLNGQSEAVVVVSVYANSQVTAAANKLVTYVKKATGAELPLTTSASVYDSTYDGLTRIYVGMTDPAGDAAVPAQLQGIEGDGYVINPEGSHITIIGPTVWGTEYGVDEFLERYVGVRWLMPTANGEDVPFNPTLTVSGGTVFQQPTFVSREFDRNVDAEWARNNRMRGSVKFTHNLKNLIPPSKYLNRNDSANYHPEWFPRTNLTDSDIYSWQPCLTAPGIVDEAIKNLKNYFAANPGETSYSLGVNDSGGFCEDKPGHPDNPNRKNSIGYTDMSNVYFSWVEQVVEGVLQTYPDKTFGVYAYRETYDPPTNVTLNPHIYVYITDDRLTWQDPQAEAAGHDITEKWHAVAPSLAFYEYMWGDLFLVPRVYNTVEADRLRYGAANGVKALYSEMSVNWGGEGAKPWVLSKLQWNPNQDAKALENEWYERAVGPAAAADLKAYYDHWEQFWTDRVFRSLWYQTWINAKNHNNYVNYTDASYLADVTASEIAQSRTLLESVVAKAGTPAQKLRAQAIMNAFEFYEASALSYPRPGVVAPPANETEAMALLNAIKDNVELAEQRTKVLQTHATEPWAKQPFSTLTYNLLWSGINGDKLPPLVDWLKSQPAGNAVELAIRAYAATSPSAKVRDFAKLLLATIENQPTVNGDPSFEIAQDPTGNDANWASHPNEWSYWKEPILGTEQMHKTTDIAHTGDRSLYARLVIGGPIQYIPSIVPGHYGGMAYVYTAAGTEDQAVSNAGFEQFAAGKPVSWMCSKTNVCHKDDDAHSGANSVRLNGNANTGGDNSLTSEHIPVKAGELYRASAYNKNASGTSAIAVEYWSSAGDKLGEARKTNATTGNWSAIETEGYAPKGTAYATIRLSQEAGDLGTTFFDDVSFVRVKQPKGTMSFSLNLYDANNKLLGSIKSDRTLAALRPGRWSTVHFLEEIPANVGSSTVKSIMLSTSLYNYTGDDNEIYVDDVALYRLDDQPFPANAEFERAAADQPVSWTCSAVGSCLSVTDRVYGGTHSVKLADAGNGASVSLRSDRIPVTPGELYKAGAYNYNDSVSSAVYVEFWNGEGVKLAEASQAKAAVAAWSAVEAQGVAPAGAAYATIRLGKDAGNGAAYFDKASFARVTLTVDNGNFESVTAGKPTSWTCSPTTACSTVTDIVYGGTRSVKLTDTSNTTAVSVRSAHIPATAGITYKAGAYSYNQSGKSVLYLEFWNSSGTRIGFGFQGNSTLGAWTPLTVQQTAPAGTAYATVLVNQDTGNVGTAYFDNVTIQTVP